MFLVGLDDKSVKKRVLNTFWLENKLILQLGLFAFRNKIAGFGR